MKNIINGELKVIKYNKLYKHAQVAQRNQFQLLI